MKTYRFGIIGCGIIADWHSTAIDNIENAVLTGVFDVNLTRAEEFAKNHCCKVFSTLEDMLTCPKVDIVCICTPSGLHAEAAIAAANAGKHIIVEKPMAITRKQLSDIVEAVERNGVMLTSISQRRFSACITKIKNAIDSGKLGRLLIGDISMKFYRSHEYYASAGWRGTWSMDGGGVLMNQGIHFIDLLQHLMGPVKSVSAICRTLDRDIEVEDTCVSTVEYENGAVGIIEGTTCAAPGFPTRIEIIGTKGSIIMEDLNIVKWFVDGEELDLTGSEFDSIRNTIVANPDLHTVQFRDLLRAIETGTKPAIDVYEGKRPVDVILSIYDASASGQRIYLSNE